VVTTSISERPRPSRATPLPVRRLVSLPPAGQVCSAVPRRSRTKRSWLGSTVAWRRFPGINDNNALGFHLILLCTEAGRFYVKTYPVGLGRKSACVSMAGRGDCDTEKCIGYIFLKGQCNVNVGFSICCASTLSLFVTANSALHTNITVFIYSHVTFHADFSYCYSARPPCTRSHTTLIFLHPSSASFVCCAVAALPTKHISHNPS
jgi:hypothetical protein